LQNNYASKFNKKSAIIAEQFYSPDPQVRVFFADNSNIILRTNLAGIAKAVIVLAGVLYIINVRSHT